MSLQNGFHLPLCTSDFANLREQKQIYIDKTDLIYDFAKKSIYCFLSRPRRFGKTLLISTLESLFRDGIKYFDGLKIEKLWKDKKYSVLKIDFSLIHDFFSFEDFINRFRVVLDQAFILGGFSFHSLPNERPEETIGRFLIQTPRKSLVLLVDEYDSPFNEALHQPELFKRVQSVLSNFYAEIKSKSFAFRFIFLTGIAKFNKASIFSSLNNLIDLSLNPRYGTLLGYTEEEITSYFGEYLTKAAQINNTTEENIIKKIRSQYDGFCFDFKASTHVYAPWSVLNFLTYPENGLKNYWYMSSGRLTVLENYLKGRKILSSSQYNLPQYLSIGELDGSCDIDTLNDITILTQTGYLTIKKVLGDNLELGYPNKEVALSMADLSLYSILKNKNKLGIDAISLHEKFSSKNPLEVIDLLNSVFRSIHYTHYPVDSEATCQALVQLLLIGAGLSPWVEKGYSKGRSDLEVSIGESRWVFEFKFLPKPKVGRKGAQKAPESRPSVNNASIAMLAQALEQFRKKEYGQDFNPASNLICVALVFSREERQFSDWATYPISKRDDVTEEWKGALAGELAKLGWEEAQLAALH